METLIARDEKYRKILKVIRIIYGLTGIVLAIRGIVRKSPYESLLPLATLLLIPGLSLARRLFGWKGGWQLETYIYLFSYLGWSLGGAAAFYVLIPGYDKVIHCLSGVFVGILALAFYEMLERRHSKEGANPATSCFFVFFASMAVAGLFELGEYVTSPHHRKRPAERPRHRRGGYYGGYVRMPFGHPGGKYPDDSQHPWQARPLYRCGQSFLPPRTPPTKPDTKTSLLFQQGGFPACQKTFLTRCQTVKKGTKTSKRRP